jgi:hypothetical protein
MSRTTKANEPQSKRGMHDMNLWGTEYEQTPKTLDSTGTAGANYSSQQLEAFKRLHNIPTMKNEDELERARR